MRTLYVAFKGKGNSSNRIVSSFIGEKIFLTNSYNGLKRDIDSINNTYDVVYMFGLDKDLNGKIRIDRVAAKDGVYLGSNIDLDLIANQLNKNGISTYIGNMPTNYLCNEAYWYMLKKYNNNVVFFHVPSIKHINNDYIERIAYVLSANLLE